MDLHQELPLPPLRRWTRDEYERAIVAGLFDEDEGLELLEGRIVQKMPQRGPHSASICLTETALQAIFGAGFDVRSQLPLALGDSSEPEPDVAVVRGSIRDYEVDHPTTAVLVVEVSDTSLAVDRKTKAGIYAKGTIPEYWLLNLAKRCLEVYRDPSIDAEQPLGWAYASLTVLDESAVVAPLAAPDMTVRVTDLLPRRRS